MNIKFDLKKIIIVDLILVLAIAACFFLIDEPGRVTRFDVVRTTYDSAWLKWKPAKDSTGYAIYRSEDGRNYDFVATTSETEYIDSDLRTGSTYTYYISSHNGIRGRASANSSKVKAHPSLSKPELKVSTKKGYVQLNITPVAGATGYMIYRDKKMIMDQTDTKFIDAEAVTDKTHKYTVKAYRYKKHPVYSEFSKTVKATLKAISKLFPSVVGDDILFDWDDNAEYTDYKLYLDDELLTETTDTQYTLTGFDPEKTYTMKLIGYSADGKTTSPEVDQTFEITSHEMTNQDALDAACDWAVMIAEDNSFTYGSGSRAHRYGCYFCGTNVGPNLNKKGTSLVDGHSYEKTYCCNPFVHACYAHGAGDPNMLAACQNGKGIAMSKGSFTRYGNWKSVGKPSLGNLQKGDVLVRSDHVSIYIGDGKIVQAVKNDWSDESIDIYNLPSKSYNRYSFVMRYTGNGRGTKYEIEEKA